MWEKFNRNFTDSQESALVDAKKSGTTVMECIVLAILIVSAIVAGVVFWGEDIMRKLDVVSQTLTVYAGPEYYERRQIHQIHDKETQDCRDLKTENKAQ